MIKATKEGVTTGKILPKTDEDKAAILELFTDCQRATELPEKNQGIWRAYDEKD